MYLPDLKYNIHTTIEEYRTKSRKKMLCGLVFTIHTCTCIDVCTCNVHVHVHVHALVYIVLDSVHCKLHPRVREGI